MYTYKTTLWTCIHAWMYLIEFAYTHECMVYTYTHMCYNMYAHMKVSYTHTTVCAVLACMRINYCRKYPHQHGYAYYMCVYVYIYIHIHTHMYIYISAHIHKNIFTSFSLSLCVYACMICICLSGTHQCFQWSALPCYCVCSNHCSAHARPVWCHDCVERLHRDGSDEQLTSSSHCTYT